MPTKTTSFQVFISHSSIDTWVAQQIALHIERSGAITFLDKNDIQHGDNFDQEILRGIYASTEFLVLFTPWALSRPYIWYEAGVFRGHKKGKGRIIGVVYNVSKEELSARLEIPAWFKQLDMVEINDLNSYFAQLKRRVSNRRSNG